MAEKTSQEGTGPCCDKGGFRWNGTPTGSEAKLADNVTYVTGNENSKVAILFIHDALGWKFNNNRLLADHYAREAGARVFLPDFFGGQILPEDDLLAGRWHNIDLADFQKRNAKDVRFPEILACARALRQQYSRVGAIGFCYGGWAVFQLGAASLNPSDGPRVVDAISAGHPSWLTKEEIDEVAVPVQIVAPEFDHAFSPELKEHSNRVIPTKGIDYDYQLFPGVEHAFASRGDSLDPKNKRAMARAMSAAAYWFNFHLNWSDDEPKS